MSKKVNTGYSDYCPHIDSDHEIDFEYNCRKQLGNDHEDHYAVGYSCDESDNCNYHHRDECPVYESAKKYYRC